MKENQKPEDLLGCPEDSDLHGEIGNAGEVVRPDNEAINQLLCQTKDTGRNVSLPNETESGKLQDGLSEGKAFVTRSVPKIIYKMCAKYNLPFDSTKLPRIEFSKDKNLDGTYEPDTNTLTISEYVLSSDSELFEAIGEEVGHYLRYQLCSSSRDPRGRLQEETTASHRPVRPVSDANVDEFFGFLGRRMFNQTFEHWNLEDPVPPDREWYAERLLKARRAAHMGRELIGKLEQRYQDERRKLRKGEDSPDFDVLTSHHSMASSIRDKQRLIRKEALHLVEHRKGYEVAARLDLDSVEDWEALFRMPNHEVRERYFVNYN
ncbi:MAG: hypothetical protein QF741_01065 [Candidatus Peribacteraceae bacterium]|nr:hypothetical protein [Candidatus Peribacteraceae bacterium]MDP7454270.1 hypothetical protein [Candidatus Peribacteraceae bacterium]MDP7645760.1 hypothetical protein [Candidatus Peribacteraceae bacterium]